MGFSLQSKYQCSRIALIAAMDLKGDFSAEKMHIFIHTTSLRGREDLENSKKGREMEMRKK
jgi:hypothetical protein